MMKWRKNTLIALAALFVFQAAGIIANAETVGAYDADAAVAYAVEHFDDTDPTPDCIRFTKECLEAGGVPTDSARTYGYTVEDYVSYAVNNGYADFIKLTTQKMEWDTPQWYVPAEENADKLSVGDGIIYVCTSCGKYFHAAIHTKAAAVDGVEGEFAYYYAQNVAVEDKPLCAIDCSSSSCKAGRENVDIYSLHITSNENGYDDHYDEAVISGLNAETTEDEKVRISWDSLEGASGYKVFKKNGSTSAYNFIGETTETSLIYEELPEAGEFFYFAVRPYSEADGKVYVGKMSDMVSYSYVEEVVGQLETPVVKGSNVASSGKPRFTWEAVAGAAEYHVYRATNKTGTYKHVYTAETTSYTHSSAEAGKTYYYKIMAVSANDSATNSEFSEILTRTCDLARPAVKSANVSSSGKPKLTWSAVEGADKYYIYRATSKTGTYTKTKTTTSTSYTNTSAVAGKTYYYKVVAVDADKSAANSAYSEIITRTCDLARPTVTASNASSGKPKLTWKKVEGADKYYVYRATSKNGTYQKVKTTTSTSFTNTSAVKGKTYYYKVKAVDANKSAANSAYSLIVSKKCK